MVFAYTTRNHGVLSPSLVLSVRMLGRIVDVRTNLRERNAA
jgi:hypothetical protein